MGHPQSLEYLFTGVRVISANVLINYCGQAAAVESYTEQFIWTVALSQNVVDRLRKYSSICYYVASYSTPHHLAADKHNFLSGWRRKGGEGRT